MSAFQRFVVFELDDLRRKVAIRATDVTAVKEHGPYGASKVWVAGDPMPFIVRGRMNEVLDKLGAER